MVLIGNNTQPKRRMFVFQLKTEKKPERKFGPILSSQWKYKIMANK